MTRHLVAWLALQAATFAASAQELPRPTPEGRRAVTELADAAVSAGGLARQSDSKSGESRLVVADPDALRKAVSANRQLLSPEAREALIGLWPSLPQRNSSAHLALLRAAGEETGDGRVLAFAALFAAGQANSEQRFNVADREFRAAIRRFSELKDIEWEARARHQQAVFYEGVGKSDEAADGFRRALKTFRELGGEKHPMIPSSLQGLGAVLEHQGKYAEAVAALSEAVRIIEAREGALSRGLSDTLTSLGFTYFTMGQPARAVESLKRALEIREKLLGPDDIEVAKALDNLGELHLELAETDKALELFRRAGKIFGKLLEPDHPDRAINLAMTGRAAAAMERYDESLDCFRRALASLEQVYGPDDTRVAAYLSEMAGVYFQTGDHGRALEVLERVLKIRRARFGESHRAVAVTLSKIGYAQRRLGHPEVALERYREALAMFRGIYGEKHPEVAANLNNVAKLRSELGDPNGALDDYRHVLEIYRSIYGENHPNLATVYGNIGGEELRLGQFDAALADANRALEIDRAYFGERHSEVASSLYNISKIYSSRGDHSRAMESIDAALAALQTDARAEARSFARQDVDSVKAIPFTLVVLRGRGEELVRRVGRDLSIEPLRDYIRTLELAAEILERIRRVQIRTDIAKVAIGEAAADFFPRLVHALGRLGLLTGEAEPLRRAFAVAEQGTARVFLEALGRSRARVIGRVDPGLLEQEANLTSRLSGLDGEIGRQQALPLDRRDPQVVGGLFDRRETLERELSQVVARMEKNYPSFAAMMYPRPTSLENAMACLGPREVALHFIPGADASSLLVLDREGPSGGLRITFHELPPAAEITELVPRFLRPTGLEDDETLRELGAKAYRMLLEPAAREIAGKDLVIVPGGALGRLPFQLLVEPAAGAGGPKGSYLVSGHRIRYAPSMTTLYLIRLWEQTRPQTTRPFWAVGDPVYGADDPRLKGAARAEMIGGSASDNRFERLPATGEEVERLRLLLHAEPEDVLTGTGATKQVVGRLSSDGSLARYRYVHFACHGILGYNEGEQPALVLSPFGDRGKDDAFLRLDEVANLRLNANLVTLSACQTGQGRVYEAEGISGLARAFLFAGSRGVLCSLWKVADRETANLILDVYTGLGRGEPPADALRAAQLRAIDAGQPPFLWAPFVLVGE